MPLNAHASKALPCCHRLHLEQLKYFLKYACILFLISLIMFTAGTAQRKLKDTGVQDGRSGRLLGNENNYYLLN